MNVSTRSAPIAEAAPDGSWTYLTTEVLTLETLAPKLSTAYKGWKSAEKEKNDRKEDFFLLANAALIERGIAMKVIDIEAASEEQARERVTRHHPGWIIDLARPHRIHPGIFEVIVAEDPSKKSFSYEHEGVKYARQVRKGTVMVDDEWLMEDDPELYEAITFELPWGARVTRPIESLDKMVIAQLSKYIYNDEPRVSLAAPRKVKEEEE